jgi:hypothetical protein
MDTALRESIEKDLLYELKYLLCAATEWEAQRVLVGELPQQAKIPEPCAHIKVYSMDSAFVHARCLYEFSLAADILDVWGRFSKHPDLKDYAALLDETRKQAIKEAEDVANQYAGFKCPFSEANP